MSRNFPPETTREIGHLSILINKMNQIFWYIFDELFNQDRNSENRNSWIHSIDLGHPQVEHFLSHFNFLKQVTIIEALVKSSSV